MHDVVAHLARAHAEYKHPYTIEREVKAVGFVMAFSDRGLCGGLNVNLFRKTAMARYIESLIYQEVAMKSATDNASKLIDEL